MRGKDEFKDFVKELNIIVESFRKRFTDIKERAEGLTKSIIEMEKVSDKPDILRLKKQEMMREIEALEGILSIFKR